MTSLKLLEKYTASNSIQTQASNRQIVQLKYMVRNREYSGKVPLICIQMQI